MPQYARFRARVYRHRTNGATHEHGGSLGTLVRRTLSIVRQRLADVCLPAKADQ